MSHYVLYVAPEWRVLSFFPGASYNELVSIVKRRNVLQEKICTAGEPSFRPLGESGEETSRSGEMFMAAVSSPGRLCLAAGRPAVCGRTRVR